MESPLHPNEVPTPDFEHRLYWAVEMEGTFQEFAYFKFIGKSGFKTCVLLY
jgi:hypothetical protein